MFKSTVGAVEYDTWCESFLRFDVDNLYISGPCLSKTAYVLIKCKQSAAFDGH